MINLFEKQQEPSSDIIEVGKELGERLEQIRQSRIRPETFRGTGLFTDEEIDSDLALVERKEEEFRKQSESQIPEQAVIRKNADILEVMLPMVVQDFNWLGENTNLIYTSRYDDIARGIDSVAELIDPTRTQNVGMEIDFTSSEEEMKEKIKRIGSRIESGQISSVKYFDSPQTGKKKEMEMPKIAFGAPMRDMNEFVSVVAEAYLGKRRESAKREIQNHKLKDRFIELTARQLQEFGTLAAGVGNIPNALLHHNVLERFKQRRLIK